MKKYATYRAEREKGLTYQEIADKYGVSKQCIYMACGKGNPTYFQPFTQKRCVYPNLRNWINDNKICAAELIRRLGYEYTGRTASWIRTILAGKGNIKKTLIDKLIALTGMTYEELFKEDDLQ